MKALIPFEIGDIAVNAYNQKVRIDDICNDEVVFVWLYQDSVEVVSIDEFDEHFIPIREKEEQKPPSRRKGYR